MKFLRSKRLWFLVLAMPVVWLAISNNGGPRYRRCGHRLELKARLLVLVPYWQWFKATQHWASYLTMHGCSGDRARATLEQLAFAQQTFQARLGRPANSLSELGLTGQDSPHDNNGSVVSGFRIEYEVSPQGWCACIPQQRDLPGHYLVLSNVVFFCEAHRPTTNDYPLTFIK